MVDAIPAYTAEKSVAVFEKFNVFTKAELQSRVEIEYETYAKMTNIEAKAMIDIAGKQIIPAVIKFTTALAASINGVRAVYYRDVIKTAMEALRAPVDKLEMMVDKDMWPMPSYGDLIFEV